VTVPTAAGVIVLGRFLLGLFGDEFVAAYPALVILAAGQIVNALCGTVGSLMIMTRLHREAATVFGGAAALNIALNAVLIPRFGLNGAAIATSTTVVLWNVVMVVLVVRKLGVNPTPFRLGGI
jgi:O-antigen/teichoic acid export membrane protein